MIPTAANSDYPKFVPDQVLTSDNLNDLFGYLDEQGRMTRTNLSGIGIVCGLEVKTAADGSSITITKGVGVTSSGYLVTVREVTYTKRTTAVFDAVKCEYYDRLVNIGAKTQKFDLWELKQEAESTGTTALNNSFLTSGEKIVLIFVELLEENNKNCDPNSCDDKGVNVTVNFRPLLVEKANVAELLSGAGAGTNPWLTLPEISMRRFDVTATPMYECVQIFNAYKKILSAAFLAKTQTALTQAYTVLQPLLADEFPANPFATLADDYKFLYDGTISPEQLVAMQYYYDLFSDILLAYKEFSDKGIEVIGMCCPDDIFPRHLLLDLARPDTNAQTSSYRHYFIPSPILSGEHKTVNYLKVLFRKLVLLTDKFTVPPPTINGANKTVDSNIRITPSLLADVPFTKKSIPYYYNIGNANDELLKNWSPEKLAQGKTKRNLSYHAIKYNLTDDEIRRPLLYDLEPYNFLRVEGHIGKPYQHVVKNIISLRDKSRLPFEVVAVNADISATIAFLRNLTKLMTSGNAAAQSTLQSLMGGTCHFNDLELLYDSIMAELTARLSNEMKFFYDIVRDGKRGVLHMPPPATNVPQATLLQKTDPVFRFLPNTIGHEFELFYATVKNQPFISFAVFFQSFGQGGNNDFMDFGFKAILYYTEKLFETSTTSLSSFSFFDFYTRYYSLIFVVRYLKLINKFLAEQYPLKEEENDHLDALLSIAADGRMTQLYLEFIRRILTVKIMQQAGYYFSNHPAVQHKAGVPVGGTFIVVYHETDKTVEEQNPAVGNIAVAANIAGNQTTTFKVANTEASAATEFSGAAIANEKVTAADHIAGVSADIQEKVMVAGKKIVDGLEKSFRVSTANTQKSQATTGLVQNNAAGAALAAGASKNSSEAVMKYLLDAMAYLKNREDDVLDEAIEDFNDGIVVADFYLPYLCCSDCPPIQIVIGAETEKPNQPPVARPGDNVSIQLPVDAVNLDGSTSSDPDGTIKTYLWEKQSGPDAHIETGGESKTKVSGLKEGVYVFKLTVTDDDGATNSATVTVTVLPKPNTPPVAVASANPTTLILNAATVTQTQLSSAGSSDADGDVLLFNWSLPAGTTGANIVTPNAAGSVVQFSAIGTYVFTLKVTDSKGASATATVTVTVNPRPNAAPIAVASANPTTLVLGVGTVTQTQLSSAGSSDPDGDQLSFNWSLPAGTQGANITNPNNPNTAAQFSAAGVYVFTLRVTDSKGAFTNATVTVTVNPRPNMPPVAVATANPNVLTLSQATVTQTQLLSTGSSDPDGDQITVNWSLPQGTVGANILSPNAANTLVQFTIAGVYVFTLKVTDSKNAVTTATVTVTVNPANRPPIANATATPSQATLSANNSATVNLSSAGSSDPDNDPLTFQWSLPAGTSGAAIQTPNAPNTSVVFNAAGTFVFTLIVKDNKGGTASRTVTVVISPGVNLGPTARASISPSTVNIVSGQTVDATLIGSKSSDPEGDTLVFLWSQSAGARVAKIEKPKQATTKVTFDSSGAYEFTLKVTDTGKNVSATKVTINVLPVPG